MLFRDAGALRYFTFENLNNQPVTHAVFTRHGGVSEGAYAELNVGATVGDEATRVEKNLQLAFSAVDRPRQSIFDSWLVHGTHVLVANEPRPVEWAKPLQADIIITNKPEVTLFMRYADCVPIIFYDPAHQAIGLAHAGWRGTVAKVAEKAVEAMQTDYGSRPEDMTACIGPAICSEHYEVGEDVVGQARAAFGDDAETLLPRANGSVHFDLVGANRLTLQQAGIRNIEISGLCTAADTANWFSHRASGGRTGRFGALIALKQ
jgi:hypothetical protein